MSGNAKAIRVRIKSVESTAHITRAMQLVASSKLRRATERMERSRYFYRAVTDAFSALAAGKSDSPYLLERPVRRSCYIVLAGDRGLAGGYNANVFRMAAGLVNKDSTIIAIGRRSCEYFSTHGFHMTLSFPCIEKLTMSDCVRVGQTVRDLYATGQIDEAVLIYTEYVSVLSQVAKSERLLPLTAPDNAPHSAALTEYEPDADSVLNAVIPQYITGLVWGSVCMSFAAELAARRNAMDSATKNASDMIDRLSLSYNRARQSAITQEITEIVAGSEQ